MFMSTLDSQPTTAVAFGAFTMHGSEVFIYTQQIIAGKTMADNKTHPNAASVQDYLQSRASGSQLDDCKALIDLMQQLTGEPATMWGPSMVGFGRYRYTYASGHSGESF